MDDSALNLAFDQAIKPSKWEQLRKRLPEGANAIALVSALVAIASAAASWKQFQLGHAQLQQNAALIQIQQQPWIGVEAPPELKVLHLENNNLNTGKTTIERQIFGSLWVRNYGSSPALAVDHLSTCNS